MSDPAGREERTLHQQRKVRVAVVSGGGGPEAPREPWEIRDGDQALMQATVRSFDAATGSGSVFLDDGTVCAFSAGAFALSGTRLLRAGQRVTIRHDRDGAITALTLPTLPFPGEPGGSADPSV